jgi:hypothetical protein
MRIFFVDVLPIGTAKDFDFTFKNQTEFIFENVERNDSLDKEELGLSEDNLIMTPKK